MDIEIALGLIAIGLVLGIPVSIVVLFVSVSGLRRRLESLEARLLEMQRDRAAPRRSEVPPRAAEAAPIHDGRDLRRSGRLEFSSGPAGPRREGQPV